MIWCSKRSIGAAAAALFGATVSATAGGQIQAQSQPAETCNEQRPQTEQIRCFIGEAEAAKDSAICERPEDFVVRFHCLSLYAEHSLDTGPCQRIEAGNDQTQTLRDSCIGGVAIAGRDPGICSRIGRTEIRDGCYLMLVVQFETDPEICGQIENPKVQSLCRD